MTTDPGELRPLISQRFCAALWLGSIALHELTEKPCRDLPAVDRAPARFRYLQIQASTPVYIDGI